MRNEFALEFPGRAPPVKTTIRKIVNKFSDKGTVHNQNAFNSGRHRTTRTPENVERVRLAIEVNPEITSRRSFMGIPKSSFNEITRVDLNYHPYRIHVRQKLDDFDYNRRTRYCAWIVERFQDPNFSGKIVIGDESGFCMNGHVSTHNVVMYAPRGEPPDFHYDVPESREKVTVWAALCGNGEILGPHFFDANVNGEIYVNMIDAQVVPEMDLIYDRDIFGDVRYGENIWWFQDGAPCHQRRIVTDRIEELFGNQVVALNHGIEWPPRSPDLTPCDFFLWGYLKARVYRTPPRDLFELRQRIIDEFELLRNDRPMVIRVVEAMLSRARTCIERNGGHVEGHFVERD